MKLASKELALTGLGFFQLESESLKNNLCVFVCLIV